MTQGRWGARLGLAVLGAGMLAAGGPLIAQTNGAWSGETSADALSRNLRALSDNPRSLAALMGAGQAALGLGDARAALTFFARAEEVSPRDGRIKMWMASALVQLEQPRAALKFFKDATDLGVAEAEVAGDRGLAYDISGDPRRAQRDYRLALQHGGSAEVVRRLALSLAITGDREAALQQLEPQLRAGDRAAERTRALVLALTGDTEGAGAVVQAAMPGPQGEAMMPFLARLPSLSYADRALAVHLGHFPNAGRGAAAPAYAANTISQPSYSPSPRDPTEAGRPDPAQALLQRRVASAAPQPKPATPAPAKPAPRVAGTAPTVSSWSWQRREAESPSGPLRRPETGLPPGHPKPRTEPPHERAEGSAPVEIAHADPAPLKAPSTTAPEQASPEPSVPAPADAPASSRLADLAAVVASIAEPPLAPPRPAARRETAPAKPSRIAEAVPAARPGGKHGQAPAAAAADEKPDRKARTAAATPPKKPAPPREPSRVWVQVAGGADRDALPREYARLKAKAPKLLGTRTAWTARLNATNRLLVGPFADAEAAQDFVNALKKADLSGFAWTSEAGEKVEKLPAK